jgi:hypothetical protein
LVGNLVLLGRCDTGNALEVVNEFDVLEAGALEERLDVGHLAEAKFKHEVSAGNEGSVRGWD